MPNERGTRRNFTLNHYSLHVCASREMVRCRFTFFKPISLRVNVEVILEPKQVDKGCVLNLERVSIPVVHEIHVRFFCECLPLCFIHT